MTRRDPDIEAHDTDAKLARQHLEQLSALVDGDLAPDQARFLLRRLAHDPALAGRLERWQLAGDVLRGQPVRALPGGADGFAARVSAAVAREGRAAPRAPGANWRHGVGVALAASVAAVALFVSRPLSVEGELREPAVAAVASAPAVSGPAVAAQAEPDVPTREVAVPQFTPPADAAIAAAEVREVPRAVAIPPAVADDATMPVASAAAEPVLAAADVRPFATPVEPQARPWPRAVLPALGGESGALTVGLGDSAPAPSFYPFDPRWPAREDPSDAGADDTAR